MKSFTAVALSLILVALGSCAYLMLLHASLGPDMDPADPHWPWQLAFEHGELEFEHLGHLIVVLGVALPVGLAAGLIHRLEGAPFAVVLIGVIAGAVYGSHPQAPYIGEQTWMLEYSVALAATEMAVAPLLWYGLIRFVVLCAKRMRNYTA